MSVDQRSCCLQLTIVALFAFTHNWPQQWGVMVLKDRNILWLLVTIWWYNLVIHGSQSTGRQDWCNQVQTYARYSRLAARCTVSVTGHLSFATSPTCLPRGSRVRNSLRSIKYYPNLNTLRMGDLLKGLLRTDARCGCRKFCKNIKGLRIHQARTKCGHKPSIMRKKVESHHSTWNLSEKDSSSLSLGDKEVEELAAEDKLTRIIWARIDAEKAWYW